MVLGTLEHLLDGLLVVLDEDLIEQLVTLRYLHRASDHLGNDLRRLARLGRFLRHVERSFSIRSAGTCDDDSATGFTAVAMCMATSLAATSSPVNSTITWMCVPCR